MKTRTQTCLNESHAGRTCPNENQLFDQKVRALIERLHELVVQLVENPGFGQVSDWIDYSGMWALISAIRASLHQ